MRRSITKFIFAVIATASLCNVYALQLITPKEAKLPEASGTLKTRGISRGPGIRVSSPDLAAAEIKSPFDLKVEFESRGGNKIDASAIKITYLKADEVDLTPRLKIAISETGIDLTKAEVPPGEHLIKITVKDVDGRETNTVLNLNVIK